MYYDCKSTGKRSKHSKSARNLFVSSNHDAFYWTGGGKNRKNLNTELVKQKSPDKQQQQQIHGFYPSYKKSLRKRLASAVDNDKLSDSDLTETETERRFLNYPSSSQQPQSQMTPSSLKHYQGHQVMISNEDLSDTNLIPPHPGGLRITPPLPSDQHLFYQSQQHHQLPFNHHHHPHQFRHKQSNSCDLPDEFSSSSSCRISPGGGGSYYHNQDSSGMHDEPVYEEILSNRASDSYDNNGDDDSRCGGSGIGNRRSRSDHNDYDDNEEDEIMAVEEERFSRMRRMIVSGNNDDDLRQQFK